MKDGEDFREVIISEGDVYMVPPYVPHVPLTSHDKDTVGTTLRFDDARSSGPFDTIRARRCFLDKLSSTSDSGSLSKWLVL